MAVSTLVFQCFTRKLELDPVNEAIPTMETFPANCAENLTERFLAPRHGSSGGVATQEYR
jgi:hypothetical protein